MTLSANNVRNEYTASAGQTVFNYTFKIYDSTDLGVYLTPSGQVCSPSDLTTSYTVSGVGLEAGGTITLTTPANAGDLITIISSIPTSRTTDYQNNGDFRPDTVNDDFDRTVSLVKQVEDKASRGLSFDDCLQNVSNLSLPPPVSQSFLRWKTDLSGLENVTLSSSGIVADVSVTDYTALRALTSADYTDGQVIFVTNDGVAGGFVVKTGTVTDNGITLIVFTDDSDRYAQRVVDKVWFLSWSNAALDGTTDDQSAVQDFIDFVETQGGGHIYCDPSKTCALGSAVTLGASGTEVFLGSFGKNGARFKALSAFTGGMFIELAGGLNGVELEGFDKDTPNHDAVEIGNGTVTNPFVSNTNVLNIGGWYRLFHTDYEYDRAHWESITSEVELGYAVFDLQTGGSYAHAANPKMLRLSLRNPDTSPSVSEQKKYGIILKRSEGAEISGAISNFDRGIWLNGENREVDLNDLLILDLRSTPANDLWQSAWAATTAYSLNDYRRPTAANANGHFYIVTSAGTSDGSEPTWPTSDAGTVVDGTVTWTEVGESIGLYVGAEQQVNVEKCRFEDAICAFYNASNANTKIGSSRLVGENAAILNMSSAGCELNMENCLIAGDIELSGAAGNMAFAGTMNLIQSDTLGQVPSHENGTYQAGNSAYASGNGIDFSQTSRSGATSQILDDYAEGTYTPVATNLTEVGGAATITGFYTKKGNEVYFQITVTPVTNTSATANSTYFTSPFGVLRASTCQAVGLNSTTSLGVGRIDDTNERIYVPSWTTEVGQVVITGSYISSV